jgi:hypothetical protein
LNIELLDKDELEEKEQAIRSKYEEVLKLEWTADLDYSKEEVE